MPAEQTLVGEWLAAIADGIEHNVDESFDIVVFDEKSVIFNAKAAS